MHFAKRMLSLRSARLGLALSLFGVLAFSQLGLSGELSAGHSDRYLGHAKAPLFAVAPPGDIDKNGFSARVTAVLRGDLLELEDGRSLRMAGVHAPFPEGQGKAFVGSWPAYEESRAALEALTLGRNLWVVPTSPTPDRYGRLSVLLYDEEGRDLHEMLLKAGWLRLNGDGRLAEDNSDYAGLEARARFAGRGLWAYRAYQVWPADDADEGIGRFGIVEGQVLSVASVRKRLYLNFGSDWRNDFTAMIDAAAQKAFADAGLDPQSYEGRHLRIRGWIKGRHLRIRGWIKSYNGAMIEVETPQQIEVLAP
jgi:endonuclease YncB( thermonuclease family)